ncbi:AAA family ATPase [Desertihabitans aurantiacus]|uniref:AAA family ATPase n=1 Tax=Desertihabitans aurantiacus TaxID=2282477 RepID=UPI000DF8325E|nr:ATP-binding protein [Desertihabitans aurantiacus]
MPAPRVHLLHGLPASGKTTLAQSLAADGRAVRFTLDEWVLALHELPFDHADYPAKAARTKDAIFSVAGQVLAAGVDVVLDWNHWRRAERERTVRWAAPHRVLLHVLDVPVDRAAEQAVRRARANPAGRHVLTAADVEHMVGLMEPPAPEEDLVVVRH